MSKLPEYFHFRVLEGRTKIGMQDVSDHDFVEVVRCRDCKYNEREVNDLRGNPAIQCITGLTHRHNWYCADGKKREESRCITN